MVELTKIGLKILKDSESHVWLKLGENVLLNLTMSADRGEIIRREFNQWVNEQQPMTEIEPQRTLPGMTERISRVTLMLSISRLVGQRGTCPRARVGCVIEKDGRILSTGYNGSLAGEAHCDEMGCIIQDGHCVRTVHAEANAICFAAKHGISLEGATLYTTGWARGSCPNCQKLAKSAGIKHIITDEMV